MEVSNPFEYGGIVRPDSFCNRDLELKELEQAAENARKLFICGERRIGKTSLLYRLIDKLPEERFLIAFIDVWRCIDTSDLIRQTAQAFGSVQDISPKRLLKRARILFQSLRPAITVSDDGRPVLTFTNVPSRTDLPLLSEVLGAPGRIADAFPEKRLLVIFDEFQQIRSLGDDRIEHILRSEMQKHNTVAYFFCGSRKHLLQQMFLTGGNPLYRSSGHYSIGSISTEHWLPFIKEKFQRNRISVSDEVVEEICSLAGGHPFYTQMLCATLWDMHEPEQELSTVMIGKALDTVLGRESQGYNALWESLPRNARKMLLAAAFEEPLVQPTSGHIISEYHIPSPSSARSGLEYLISHDIVELQDDSYRLNDRFMKFWLRQRFTGRNEY